MRGWSVLSPLASKSCGGSHILTSCSGKPEQVLCFFCIRSTKREDNDIPLHFIQGKRLGPREDKGDREGILHTHPIPKVIRLELFLESGLSYLSRCVEVSQD